MGKRQCQNTSKDYSQGCTDQESARAFILNQPNPCWWQINLDDHNFVDRFNFLSPKSLLSSKLYQGWILKNFLILDSKISKITVKFDFDEKNLKFMKNREFSPIIIFGNFRWIVPIKFSEFYPNFTTENFCHRDLWFVTKIESSSAF